jgi:hypothetical protein
MFLLMNILLKGEKGSEYTGNSKIHTDDSENPVDAAN